jgi:hypothetical protein
MIKKIQYVKLVKEVENKNTEDIKKLYVTNLEDDRNIIIERLKVLTGNEYNFTNQDFDKNIKPIIDGFNHVEDTIIKKDFSYHIVHFKTYESYAYEYYLK